MKLINETLTIDKGFIAFTTVNPENRYFRMTNVKGNNNLRDFYFRDIVWESKTKQSITQPITLKL